jgi:hypothetical protein
MLFSAVMKEAVSTSETFFNLNHTTLCNIPEYTHYHHHVDGVRPRL